MSEMSMFLRDLEAPFRSFRLYALEEIIRSGNSSEILAALTARRKVEDDPECQLLLEHAVRVVTGRLHARPADEPSAPRPSLTGKDVLVRFREGDSRDRLELLSLLTPKLARELVPVVPILLEDAQEPVVQAAILRDFARLWPREGLRDLVPLLRHASLSVRLGALEVFINQAPELLTRDLPRLLGSPEPRIRALAVRGILRVDLEAGLNHFRGMISHADPQIRQAALQISFYFPFGRLKPLMLQMVALESSIDLLEHALLILENNPDPEIPYRLWEMAEKTSEAKARLLQSSAERATETLLKTGILGENGIGFRKRLDAWVHERSCRRWVQDFLSALDEREGRENLQVAREAMLDETTRSIFAEAAAWPLPDSTRGWLTQLLQNSPGSAGQPDSSAESSISTPTVPEERQKSATPRNLQEMSEDDQNRLLTSMSGDELPEHLLTLKHLMEDPETSPDLLTRIIRMCLRLRSPALVDLARKQLQAQDPGLVAVSLEYVGFHDPDDLLDELGTFLNSRHPRVRMAAIKLLQRFDPTQAVSLVQAMLNSNPAQQAHGIACLVHFEFNTVREMLVAFLEKTEVEELRKTGLLLFQNNPEPENLYILYGLEKSFAIAKSDPETAALIRAIREKSLATLIAAAQMESIILADLDAQLEKRWKEEHPDKSSPTRDETPGHRRQVSSGGKQGVGGARADFTTSRIFQIGATLVIFGLIAGLLIVFMGPADAPSPDPDAADEVDSAAAAGISVKGIVEEVSVTVMKLRTDDGALITLQGTPGFKFPLVYKDHRLRVRYLPLPDSPNGQKTGRFLKFEPI